MNGGTRRRGAKTSHRPHLVKPFFSQNVDFSIPHPKSTLDLSSLIDYSVLQ